MARKHQYGLFNFSPVVPEEGTEIAFIGGGKREVVTIIDGAFDPVTNTRFARFVRADGSTEWTFYNQKNFSPVVPSDFVVAQ